MSASEGDLDPAADRAIAAPSRFGDGLRSRGPAMTLAPHMLMPACGLRPCGAGGITPDDVGWLGLTWFAHAVPPAHARAFPVPLRVDLYRTSFVIGLGLCCAVPSSPWTRKLARHSN